MRVEPKTLLLVEMTDLEAAAALEWTENLVLAGTFPPDDPPWLAEWLRVAGLDDRQRLMVLSTALPQRVLLSVVRHRRGETPDDQQRRDQLNDQGVVDELPEEAARDLLALSDNPHLSSADLRDGLSLVKYKLVRFNGSDDRVFFTPRGARVTRIVQRLQRHGASPRSTACEDFQEGALVGLRSRISSLETEFAELRKNTHVLQAERDDARRALCEAEASNPGEGMVSVPGDPDNDPVGYAAARWGAEEALRLFPPTNPIDPHAHPLLAELAKIAADLSPQERADLDLLCSVSPGSSTYVESGPDLVGKELAFRASPHGSNRVAYEANPRGRLLAKLPR